MLRNSSISIAVLVALLLVGATQPRQFVHGKTQRKPSMTTNHSQKQHFYNNLIAPRERRLLASNTPKSAGMNQYLVVEQRTPGFYQADERRVLVQHTEWLLTSGIDWVLFDWTNNIACVEGCTVQPCECQEGDLRMVSKSAVAMVDYQVERRRAGLPFLRYAVFIGPGNGACHNHLNGVVYKLADTVKTLFLDNNPDRASIAFQLDGAPVLFWWLGNCENSALGVAPGQDPSFTHPSLNVQILDNHTTGRRLGIIDAPCRDLPGYWAPAWTLDQMLVPDKIFMCKTRRWTYLESNSPTFSYVVDASGAPFAMTVSDGIRSCQGWGGGPQCTSVGRQQGKTFSAIMQLACARNPRILLVADWNAWMKDESYSEELTNSFEPSAALGTFYLDLLGKEIGRWKSLP